MGRRLQRQSAAQNSEMSAVDLTSAKYLTPGVDARIYEPQWEKGLPTAVKLLPAFDRTQNKFLPYRTSASEDPATLENFFMSLPIIKWAGAGDKKQALSCVLYDPQSVRSGEYDREANPYIALREAIRSASKGEEQELKLAGKRCNTAAWLKYINGGNRKDRIFPNPQMGAFTQVVMYTSRGKAALNEDGIPYGAGPDDKPHLMLLTERAWKSTQELLCETTNAFHAGATAKEYDKVYTYGDVTKLRAGKILILCNPSEDADHAFSQLTGEESDDERFFPDTVGDFASYVPGFVDQITVRGKEKRKRITFEASLEQWEDDIKSRILDWFEDNVFYVPENAELAVWVAKAYAAKPELLEYGWSSFPEYYNMDEVQAAIKNRTQGFVPGASDSDEDDEDEDEERFSSRRRDRKLRDKVKDKETSEKQGVYDRLSSDMDEALESTRKSRLKNKRKAAESDDSDDDDDAPAPPKKLGKLKKKGLPKRSK